jgi:hypothetical protein
LMDGLIISLVVSPFAATIVCPISPAVSFFF